MILYSITHGPRGFMIAKFDEGFNVAAVYNVNNRSCDCPAGPRPTCKHRKMLPRMIGKLDTGEFYCYETQTWHKPLGDLARPEAADPEGREALPDAAEEPPTEPPAVASVSIQQAKAEVVEQPLLPPPTLLRSPTPTIRRR